MSSAAGEVVPALADELAEPERASVGLLDTSVFIARESGRPLLAERLPARSAVSAITVGELRWGVLMAVEDAVRSRRLDTYHAAIQLEPVPVDEAVAAAWALLRRLLKSGGAKMGINDSWIAATAIAHRWALVTQDDGIPDDIPGLTVIRV